MSGEGALGKGSLKRALAVFWMKETPFGKLDFVLFMADSIG